MGYKLTSNTLIFKGCAERAVASQPSKYCILFVGDSFTEGVGYPHEETFVGLIEASLATGN